MYIHNFDHGTDTCFVCCSIGFAIAERLAADGASVVVSSRKENNVTRAVEKLKTCGYSVSGVVCHVSKASDREHLIKEAQDKFGGIDILVSNAAVNPGVGPVLEVMYKLLGTHVSTSTVTLHLTWFLFISIKQISCRGLTYLVQLKHRYVI